MNQKLYSANINATKFWSEATLVQELQFIVALQYPNGEIGWVTREHLALYWATSIDEAVKKGKRDV